MIDKYPKFVINMKSRKDRLLKIEKEFLKHNLDVTVFEAVDGKKLTIPLDSVKKDQHNAKAIYGCMLSHYNLIKHAKDQGYEYVIVFEDDVVLSDDFRKRMSYIQNLNFDMLYMGGQFGRLGVDVVFTKQRYVCRCFQVGGTYAYIMKNTVFDYVLENMNYNWGSDEFYATKVQKEFNCYAFVPFMVGHLDGFSDIANNNTSYKTVFRNFQKKRIL